MHPEVVKDSKGQCTICGMNLMSAKELGFVAKEKDTELPLVIPSTAPLVTGTRAVVYVKRTNESVFEARSVVLGPETDNYFVIISGLKEGEEVVTNGAFKIDADLQIKGKKSMMNVEGVMQTSSHNHGSDGNDSTIKEMESMKMDKQGEKTHLPKAYESVIENYLHLSEALASDDLSTSKKVLLLLIDSIRKIDKGVIKEVLALEIKGKNSINELRTYFGEISKALITDLDTYHISDNLKAYKAHCPMALEGAGADWLQRKDKVRNPYFGASMLSCGSINGGLS